MFNAIQIQNQKSHIFFQTGTSNQIQHSQRLCFCIFMQWLYIYTFCIISHKPENRTSSPLVHNCHPPCEQVVVQDVHNLWGWLWTTAEASVHTDFCTCVHGRRDWKQKESHVCMNMQKMPYSAGLWICRTEDSGDAGFLLQYVGKGEVYHKKRATYNCLCQWITYLMGIKVCLE